MEQSKEVNRERPYQDRWMTDGPGPEATDLSGADDAPDTA